MLAYALLGATGSTGSAILRCLVSHPPSEGLKLNILVRSKSKLSKTFPDLENRDDTCEITIFEGSSSNGVILQQCLKDVDVIMACVGSNEAKPGMSLIYDTTTSIVSALQVLQRNSEEGYKTPTMIQLRTASLNPVLRAHQPWLAQQMAPLFFYHIYQDLDRACRLMISSSDQSPRLLSYIFIDPPSIHDAQGTTPTGYELVLDGLQKPTLSYADLGEAFCEVAKRKYEFAGKGVGVSATGNVNETWGTLLGYMAGGLKSRVWG